MHAGSTFSHPGISRRTAIQAGAIGLLGLGINHLQALRAEAAANAPIVTAKSCIYIFLSGGLAQQDSFDMKPDAPEDIRGEFRPIATQTPGLQICEHLPMLAQRSHLWSLCRSLTHSSNEHSAGHHIMLTGRSFLPPGFSPSRPLPSDWPSIAATVGAVTQPRTNLPPAVILPEKLVHSSGRVIPGAWARIAIRGSLKLHRFTAVRTVLFPSTRLIISSVRTRTRGAFKLRTCSFRTA